MSQEQLARLALTSTRTIARIEAGGYVPRRATLARIAFALGVVPDFWLTLRSDNRATQVILMNRKRRKRCLAVSA